MNSQQNDFEGTPRIHVDKRDRPVIQDDKCRTLSGYPTRVCLERYWRNELPQHGTFFKPRGYGKCIHEFVGTVEERQEIARMNDAIKAKRHSRGMHKSMAHVRKMQDRRDELVRRWKNDILKRIPEKWCDRIEMYVISPTPSGSNIGNGIEINDPENQPNIEYSQHVFLQ